MEEGNDVHATLATSDYSSLAPNPQLSVSARPSIQNVGTNAERLPLSETNIQAWSHAGKITNGFANDDKNPNRAKTLGRAQKVRGKFSDSRREEVRSMRQRGACIRCRMLRKTVYSDIFFVQSHELTSTSVVAIALAKHAQLS